MKYIECIHCQKRYPSNRKLEAAAHRKKIRCTACGNSFPIVIYEVKAVVAPKPKVKEHDWPELE